MDSPILDLAPGHTEPRWHLDDQRLLTTVQAAEYLSISRSKIYELLSAGVTMSVVVGRSRRVPLGALRDYVAGLLDPDLSHPETRLVEATSERKNRNG